MDFGGDVPLVRLVQVAITFCILSLVCTIVGVLGLPFHWGMLVPLLLGSVAGTWAICLLADKLCDIEEDE